MNVIGGHKGRFGQHVHIFSVLSLSGVLVTTTGRVSWLFVLPLRLGGKSWPRLCGSSSGAQTGSSPIKASGSNGTLSCSIINNLACHHVNEPDNGLRVRHSFSSCVSTRASGGLACPGRYPGRRPFFQRAARPFGPRGAKGKRNKEQRATKSPTQHENRGT